MALDAVKNFCKVTVSTGYTSTDTSIVLVAGDSAKLPAPPFNLVWYDETNYPDVESDPNKEIVRVTAVDTTTDTITVLRGQEGTIAVDHNTVGSTYKMINTITEKTIDDINAHITNTSNPHLVTPAQLGLVVPIPILSVSFDNVTTPFDLPATTFTQIPLDIVSVDNYSGYDTTTYKYTIPMDGIYLCVSKIRPDDNQTVDISYGQGVNTDLVDGPWFMWGATEVRRNGLLNNRIDHFLAGDQLFLYAYSDAAIPIVRASMYIILLQKD